MQNDFTTDNVDNPAVRAPAGDRPAQNSDDSMGTGKRSISV